MRTIEVCGRIDPIAIWPIRAGTYGEHEQRSFADSACYLTWEGTEDRDLRQAKAYEGIKAVG